MVYLREVSIDNLERLGAGAFGSVYKLNDQFAIKVYHPKVRDSFGPPITNPMLRKKKRAMRIRTIGKELEYTDLIKELLFIDGEYAGVVIPYYDGSILSEMMSSPFSLKMDISHKLIRNCGELTDHHIYPMDFKLNNMMYVNGEVKLIDLDDTFTKYLLFTSKFHEMDCIGGLDESIKTFFGEYMYSYYNDLLAFYLTRERPDSGCSYEDILDYLSSKEKPEDFLFVDTSSDIETIKELIRNKRYKIVLLFDEDKYDGENIRNYLEKLDDNDIDVYDMIRRTDFERYLTNNNTRSKQLVKRKDFIPLQ